MIGVKDLEPCLSQQWFVHGYQKLERNLLLYRFGLPPEPLSHVERTSLTRFSQAVIAGASEWNNPRAGTARQLCQYAADIEASFAISSTSSYEAAHLSLLKAILLYDLAGLPGASSTYAGRNDIDPRLQDFFTRAKDSLWGAMSSPDAARSRLRGIDGHSKAKIDDLLNRAIGEAVQEAGLSIQLGRNGLAPSKAIRLLAGLAADFVMPITGDDLLSLATLIELRTENSAQSILRKHSSVAAENARHLALPVEFWPAQVEAIESGILSDEYKSFGLASPTGTGKTALTKLVIADTLAKHPGKKVIYLCPSRALVRQVANDLANSLKGIGAVVIEVGAHLTVHERIPQSSDNADVLVFTPERADLLLRVDPDFLAATSLIIVDEAHHIEQTQRGVLLEFYLWRLRRLVPGSARVVQLSAVAPNINQLTDWLGPAGKTKSLMIDSRTSKLRVGILERGRGGSAILRFASSPPYTLISEDLPVDPRRGLALLAHHLSQHGIVLVLCTSTGAAEDIAKLVAELREVEQDTSDEASQKLDAWIERELYAECPLREYYSKRVLYHHAQIPPRVRTAIEDAIRSRKADVICATTTLAEGVNFPFSTVIVESLVGRNYQISPRALWNIAGRAGRFGIDTEGHCILYRPELWAEKLENYSLEDYLRTKLADIPPVKSALATGIMKLKHMVETGRLSQDVLTTVPLSNIKIDNKITSDAREIRALINIMRVGYAHASSSGIIDFEDDEDDEFTLGFLASRQLTSEGRAYARHLSTQQRFVVRSATDDNADLMQIAARVGWSLETQRNIYNWLSTREDWQIEQFSNCVVGGAVVNFDRLGYMLGPVAKNLLAFEGSELGGFTSFIATKWIQGIPLSSMDQSDFGKLVATIYGRIQYLLPWGLFGLHELIEHEASQRDLVTGTGVRDLSALASEGVPNFDALQLVMQLNIERVDASRLSSKFRSRRRDTDVLGWFYNAPWSEIERAVQGSDRRRIDPTLKIIYSNKP
ncbi:DEAD/DEAH box helicase [Methylorubrum podarium]|uniref:DEAD/DEAH box helicase n=1 Tax=Methylorubrum podarium TaxID=200476 RepID=A0ABV1QU49_9HYPH